MPGSLYTQPAIKGFAGYVKGRVSLFQKLILICSLTSLERILKAEEVSSNSSSYLPLAEQILKQVATFYRPQGKKQVQYFIIILFSLKKLYKLFLFLYRACTN